MVKTQPANAGHPGLIPGSGRSLEEQMATHSSILTWKIPRTEEPGDYSPRGCKRVRHDLVTKSTTIQPIKNIVIASDE